MTLRSAPVRGDSAAEFPGILLAAAMVNRLGRKKTQGAPDRARVMRGTGPRAGPLTLASVPVASRACARTTAHQPFCWH